MTEDKVTYTFTNPFENVEDEDYRDLIQLFYETSDLEKGFIENLGNLAMKGNVNFDDIQKTLMSLAPAIQGLQERLEKKEFVYSQCEIIEKHKIMCVIDKQRAELIPPPIAEIIINFSVAAFGPSTKYMCVACGKTFNTIRGFRIHFAKKHKVKKNDESESDI